MSESISICFNCKNNKKSLLKFSCGEHNICTECLCFLIISKEFKLEKLQNENIFVLYCTECKLVEKRPYIKITSKLLSDYFALKNQSLICSKHIKEYNIYCSSCNKNMCEECSKEDDKQHEKFEILQNEKIKTSNEMTELIKEQKYKINLKIKEYKKDLNQKINNLKNLLNEAEKEINNLIDQEEIDTNEQLDIINITYNKYYDIINNNDNNKTENSILIKMNDLKKLSDIKFDINKVNIDNISHVQEYLTEIMNEIKNNKTLSLSINFAKNIILNQYYKNIDTNHKEIMTAMKFFIDSDNKSLSIITSDTDNTLKLFKNDINNNNNFDFDFVEFNTVKENTLFANNITIIDNSTFLTGNADGLIYLWENFQMTKIFSGHQGSVNKIIYLKNDNQFISCSEDKTIKVWDINSLESECLYSLTCHEDEINDILYNENLDKIIIISIGKDLIMNILDFKTNEIIYTNKSSEEYTCIEKFNENEFMTGSINGKIYIYSFEDYNLIKSFNKHDSSINVLHPSRNDYIICGFQDGLIKIIDIKNGELLKMIQGHENIILNFLEFEDNNLLISGSADKTIKIWKI